MTTSRTTRCPLVELQRLLDWYPLWVEVKGGSVPMMAKRYVLTSNTSPDDWYIRADPHRTVRRRISDFAERFGRLIECQAGWEASLPPGPGAGVGVILEPNPRDPPDKRCPRRHRQLARLRVNVPLLKRVLALAARALKFARSVPLRLRGLPRVRVPATCFVSVGPGATTPWYAQSPLGLRSVVLRSPLRPA